MGAGFPAVCKQDGAAANNEVNKWPTLQIRKHRDIPH